MVSLSWLSWLRHYIQATRYDGDFLKISEVVWRTKQGQMRKIIPLSGAPFYTSQFALGTRWCLQLCLNGDGFGKGTHLSFFLTIKRGEYNTLLSWPFEQVVTLMLLDIVQAFRPEPPSSSFWQPKTKINISSGCPKFAPLSVLNNPSYVRNDTSISFLIVQSYFSCFCFKTSSLLV